jgi:hypothetical protein
MRGRLFVTGWLLLLIVGCGGNRPVPVSGQVKLNGKPLANASVAFVPEKEIKGAGAGSEGKTDADGNFTLHMAQKDANGAFPGKYKVVISLHEGAGEQSNANPKTPRELVPAEYNAHSKLTFDVPDGGTSSANFVLQTNAPMPR